MRGSRPPSRERLARTLRLLGELSRLHEYEARDARNRGWFEEARHLQGIARAVAATAKGVYAKWAHVLRR